MNKKRGKLFTCLLLRDSCRRLISYTLQVLFNNIMTVNYRQKNTAIEKGGDWRDSETDCTVDYHLSIMQKSFVMMSERRSQ